MSFPLSRILLVFSFVLSGCNASGSESRESEALTMALVEELRIDGNAELLGTIPFVAVGPNGILAVGQGQDRAIRFYDAGGKLLGTVGREGDGPGEFRTVTRVGWSSDTLW